MRARAALIALACCTACAAADPVAFDWFEYTGRDAVFAQPLPSGSYRNPILAGFYPDPSVTRVGEKFYLVNSSFAYFPGIPVFESRDLVHWRQIGHAIDRPSQLEFDGLGVSRGIFAPTIEFHEGTFYVVTTMVDGGGNFFVTARDPAGPWSDPVWLPEIDGIDPSLFFDADGKAYVLNNGPPPEPPRYEGHRAIWMQEFDAARGRLVGSRRVLVNGGVDISKQPIWIEGPHLYRRNGWYYLVCAEGGTGPDHSQVVLRSRSVWGPYEPFPANPILTQRDLPADRADPIANAGHADLVEAPDGSWWAVFLASRLYDGVHYNTGRETYLLPVSWQDEWPRILERGRAIPYVAPAPRFAEPAAEVAPTTGNFTWRDEFDAAVLDPAWIHVRAPRQAWADLKRRPGWLVIEPLGVSLDALENPSFLARRQQHLNFEASTELELPGSARVAAGMAAFQGEKHWYFLGVQRSAQGAKVFLERSAGERPRTVAAAELPAARHVRLKIVGEARAYSFFYDLGEGWQPLVLNDDGSILSTAVAGGFVGAVVGPYARTQSGDEQ